MDYTIGEFAALAGVTAKTLRFYHRIGLLRPAAVDSRTGYRKYRCAQLEQLASILALKNLGMTLPEIRRFIDAAGSVSRQRLCLENLRSTVARSLRQAEQSLDSIDAALSQLSAARPIPVVVKRVPPVPVASIRARLNHYDDILSIEHELLNALPAESIGHLRGALWHRCADSGSLEGEPFVELRRPDRFAVRSNKISRRFYDVKELPATFVACAYSSPEQDAEDAYAAIRSWIHRRGYALVGPKRELYLGNVLEIQFPLRTSQ